MTHTYRFPLHTVNELNQHEHFGARQKRAKAQRGVVGLRLAADLRGMAFGLAVVTVTRVAPRRLDAHDGLPASQKAVVDGVADALGVKDNDPRLRIQYDQRSAVAGDAVTNGYGVVVMVTLVGT